MSDCPRAPYAVKAKTDFLTWSERDRVRRSVFVRDPPLCVWCLRKLGDHRSELYYQVDHIVLRAEGGGYEEGNLVLSCRPCNSARRDLSVLQFLASRFPLSDESDMRAI